MRSYSFKLFSYLLYPLVEKRIKSIFFVNICMGGNDWIQMNRYKYIKDMSGIDGCFFSNGTPSDINGLHQQLRTRAITT